MDKQKQIIATEPATIAQRILIIRGQKVMIDSDLAQLYEVTAKRLNEQVRRNISRFPDDFMFRLTALEVENLRSQIATSSYGGRRYLPYVFTEHGVAMLSSVLRSERAVQVSVFIIRAFVKMREMLVGHTDLSGRLAELEKVQIDHGDHIAVISDALKLLMNSSEFKPDLVPMSDPPAK
ncbi:MAG TPA: ORF6N domain-containing protein [Candidatus Paceibacterota bacterium]